MFRVTQGLDFQQPEEAARASLMTQLEENPPAMRRPGFDPWGWEDPLEEGTATHSSILAWRIPWALQSMGGKESDPTEQL